MLSSDELKAVAFPFILFALYLLLIYSALYSFRSPKELSLVIVYTSNHKIPLHWQLMSFETCIFWTLKRQELYGSFVCSYMLIVVVVLWEAWPSLSFFSSLTFLSACDVSKGHESNSPNSWSLIDSRAVLLTGVAVSCPAVPLCCAMKKPLSQKSLC